MRKKREKKEEKTVFFALESSVGLKIQCENWKVLFRELQGTGVPASPFLEVDLIIVTRRFWYKQNSDERTRRLWNLNSVFLLESPLFFLRPLKDLLF